MSAAWRGSALFATWTKCSGAAPDHACKSFSTACWYCDAIGLLNGSEESSP
jgi:hypothetical protein